MHLYSVHQKQTSADKVEVAKKDLDWDDCPEALSLEAPSVSLVSANKIPMSQVLANSTCSLGEFVPVLEEVAHQDPTSESHLTSEPTGSRNTLILDAKQSFEGSPSFNPQNLGNSHSSHEKLVHSHKVDKLSPSANLGSLISDDMQTATNYPRHVPVHIVNGSFGMSAQNVSSDMSYEGSLSHPVELVNGGPVLFGNIAASSTIKHHSNASSSSIHQTFPTFHPACMPMYRNQDDRQSFVHIPAAFSSLIASALLQNPAAHAAASFAATFWPFANMEASTDTPASNLKDSPERQMNPAPSLAAIAAATVAAATAWWATHGMLPLCTPFSGGYTTPVVAVPMESSEVRPTNSRKEADTPDPALKDQQLGPNKRKTSQEEHVASRSPHLSSSESAEGEDGKLSTVDPAKAEGVTGLNVLDKTKDQKLVDRSSCGSNTPSSSEVETDALEKNDKEMEKPNELDTSHLSCDPSNRRGRICSNPNNEFWKEVSEGVTGK